MRAHGYKVIGAPESNCFMTGAHLSSPFLDRAMGRGRFLS